MKHAGYIDGAFVEGEGAAFIVENPSDETVVAEVRGASAAQFGHAIRAARTAFDDGRWSALTMKARGEEPKP